MRLYVVMCTFIDLLLVALFAARSPVTAPTPIPILSSTPSPPPDLSLKLGVWHDMIYHEKMGKVVLANGGAEEGKSPDDPVEL